MIGPGINDLAGHPSEYGIHTAPSDIIGHPVSAAELVRR